MNPEYRVIKHGEFREIREVYYGANRKIIYMARLPVRLYATSRKRLITESRLIEEAIHRPELNRDDIPERDK
jgi:hypothetical protein